MTRKIPYLSAATAFILFSFGLAAPVLGADSERVSSSAGHLLNGHDPADALVFKVPANDKTVPDKYLADGAAATKLRTGVQSQSLSPDYWIYDARARVYFDRDYDGFFSGIDVTFDADTHYFSADVYARLYLSLEGGPWVLYYTTDVFTLIGASGIDDYLVRTDLVDGYPTGYYDVLIELYEYPSDYPVASFGSYDSPALAALPLEDGGRDIGIVSTPSPAVSHSSGGGGSVGLWLPVLGLLLRRSISRRNSAANTSAEF